MRYIWRLKLHRTWQLTTVLFGIVVGLSFGAFSWSAYFSSIFWIIFGVLLAVICVVKPYRVLLIAALIGGILIGVSRGAIASESHVAFTQYYGKTIDLGGTVSEDPDIDSNDNVKLRLKKIAVANENVDAEVFVTLTSDADIKRGDDVVVSGKFAKGFGSFAASMNNARLVKVDGSKNSDIALALRDDFADHVRKGIDEPSASLGLGYLLGQRRSLPEDLDNALKVAGLTHVVVASGYNLTILVRLIRRLFQKVSRYLSVYLSAILVIAFIAVTGLSPSMWRAGFVTLACLSAWYFGRKFHPVTLLALAAAVTGLIEPGYVSGNLGWQLSFAAFGGVMILAPLLQSYFFGDKKPRLIRQIIGETISAQIVTAPLILYAFGQISNVAVISNLLILPLVPLAMLFVFVTGVFGYLIPPIVHFIALPAQWLLDYMVAVAQYTAGLDWAQSAVNMPLYALLLFGVGIVAACIYLRHATRLSLRDTNLVE